MTKSSKRPGYNRKAKIEKLIKYKEKITLTIKLYKQTLAERIKRSRKLFNKNIIIGDIHMHTTFSDGASTVREMKDMADICGLDFAFITDHRTLRHLSQKRYFDEKEGLWFGEESATMGQHIGLLNPSKLFKPRKDSMEKDYKRAAKIAPFVWIPHPAGWGPSNWYSDEVIKGLWSLGDKISLEILNGHQKLTRAYDEFDEKAVKIWEMLLKDGRHISAVGGSDAHRDCIIGTTWTGVCNIDFGLDFVIKSLSDGHSFASEAPLLWLSCGKYIMGDEICKKRGSKIKINFACCDSLGLHSVRLIKNGKIIKNIKAKDVPMILDSYQYTVEQKSSYFRLECTASDQRRAFSSPIYIKASIS